MKTDILAEQVSHACTTLGPNGEEVAAIKGHIFQNRKQKKVGPRGRDSLGFEAALKQFSPGKNCHLAYRDQGFYICCIPAVAARLLL